MFTIGLDYGTNSVRALVVRCADGAELGTSVFAYPSGHEGIFLDPTDHNLARQTPADWLLVTETAICEAIAQASAIDGFSSEEVVGIVVDGTG